jgi:glucose/arabinose dehydrogenase
MPRSARAKKLMMSGIGALAIAGLLAARVAARQAAAGEKPGTVHRIDLAKLPAPFATPSAGNPPRIAERPAGAAPIALPGYTVSIYAENLENPRLMRTAPNGDIFVAETKPGRVRVMRGLGPDGHPQTNEVFAADLHQPFGIAFYPPGPNPTHVYIGNTDSVVRFPYKNGDLKASGAAETIVPKLPTEGHSTRDVAFARDGRKMFVSVGSKSNVNDDEQERDRADVLEFNPDGTGKRIYAYGIRNPVGIAVHPRTGQLWVSVNERDALGDDLVPDYVSHVEDGGFYGWPWYYMGAHQDPRHEGKHPELKSKVKVPDVPLQAHSASLGLVFYSGTQFPAQHRESIFAAEHGSWNRTTRTGYKVIRIPLRNGAATGEYQDFLTGFVTESGSVWGRPVGVTVAPDGALLVSDDGSNTIWRVRYGAKK